MAAITVRASPRAKLFPTLGKTSASERAKTKQMKEAVQAFKIKTFYFPHLKPKPFIMYSFVNSADPVLKAYYLQVTYTQYRMIHTCIITIFIFLTLMMKKSLLMIKQEVMIYIPQEMQRALAI